MKQGTLKTLGAAALGLAFAGAAAGTAAAAGPADALSGLPVSTISSLVPGGETTRSLTAASLPGADALSAGEEGASEERKNPLGGLLGGLPGKGLPTGGLPTKGLPTSGLPGGGLPL
ncbi:ATP-binding protein [Streptomyces sp. URMC 123]|uniref:ATP-binding protein n=1 Tax=Streptomyces sp. URMC 123 TaxID=3423403 RepID=UPI003F1B616B